MNPGDDPTGNPMPLDRDDEEFVDAGDVCCCSFAAFSSPPPEATTEAASCFGVSPVAFALELVVFVTAATTNGFELLVVNIDVARVPLLNQEAQPNERHTQDPKATNQKAQIITKMLHFRLNPGVNSPTDLSRSPT